MQKHNVKRSIYILPNLFTTMNLFCGFYSILASVDGRFVEASIAILIGGVFDLLDGKIARATNTTSSFGTEYDSLADLITFGLAPALLMILWVLQPMGRYGWLAGFIFMACGALRLARFNTSTSTGPDFEGLPIPAAAIMNVSVVLFFSRLDVAPEPFKLPLLILMFILSFLMVSSMRYKSLKKISFFRAMKFNKLVALILIFGLIATEPYILMFLVFSAYIMSGIVLFMLDHVIHKDKQKIISDNSDLH